MEKQVYSTIPIEEQNPTSLEKKEKGNLLSDMTGESGLIDSILDIDVVDEILSTSIYDKPEVAIREVFNNGLRQCRTAQKLGATPTINIIFDVKNNRLIFEELDSMGMTVQVSKEVYRHTGRSGNLDGSESGQFGIGKKSFRAIADSMIFETFARETNEKYAFMAKGSKFEELPEPNLKQFGTRVSFAIKKGVNLAQLAKYVSKIARFTQVKTYLIISDDLKEKPNHTSISFEKGITQIGPVEPKEFLAKKLETETKFLKWIEIDNEDYYLLLAFGHSKRDEPNYNNLVGIPISLGETEETEHERLQQNTIPDSGFSGYILNIKNERKYPPVASRDNLKQDSFDRLEKVIRADLEKFYSKIDVRTIAEYNASSQKYFIENLPSGGFQDVMPQSTINFNKLLGVRVFTFVNKPKEEDEHNYAHSDLNKFFEKNVQILCNYNKTMKRINKVIEHSSNIVVAVPDGNKHDRHSSLWIMEQAGIQSVSDYMKAKNIKVPRNGKLGDVAVRFGGYRINIEQMDLDDLTSNCIRIPKEQLIESSIREFSEYLTSDEFTLFGFFRDQKKFEDTASITLDEFLRNSLKPHFETSEGKLSAKQVLKYKKIEVLRKHESKYPEKLTIELCKKETKATLILLDNQTQTKEIQALMLASKINAQSEFGITGNHFDHLIAEQMISVLNIPVKIDKWDTEINVDWKNSPQHAVKYLGEIKNSQVREFYALAYCKIGDIWESKDKDDIKTCQELHTLFLELDSITKDKTELCKILYNKFENSEEGYQETLKELAKEVIISELKKLKSVQRYTDAINLFLKDEIQNLKVVTKKGSYRDDILISFESNQKISIGEEMIELVKDVSDGYPSMKRVTIDGKKIEVLFH